MIDQLLIGSLMIFIKNTMIFNSSDRIFKNAGMIDHFKMIDHFDRSVKVVYSKSRGMSQISVHQMAKVSEYIVCFTELTQKIDVHGGTSNIPKCFHVFNPDIFRSSVLMLGNVVKF